METLENKLKNLIIVGDRVLIKPKSLSDKTKSGLYLPPGVQEKEVVQSGYVMKVGPGYPLAQSSEDTDESWKNTEEKVKYIPLQVKEGDLAIFMQKGSIEVLYKDEKYFIVPQNQILMIEREEF
jgi:co-chaperonin GroES (HSP10)